MSDTSQMIPIDRELPSAERGDRHGFAYQWLLRFPRLLLAEDDDELRYALASIFLSDGFEVFAVPSGSDLVAALEWSAQREERPFDLVLTDLRMPGDNPLDVLRALRAHGDFTPAIVMTAFDDDALRDALGEIPCTELVGKPFNPIELENAVVVSIGRQR